MKLLSVELAISLFSGVAVGSLMAALLRPPRRLAGRVRPYTVTSRSLLGKSPDLAQLGMSSSSEIGIVGRLFGPIVGSAAKAFGDLVDKLGEGNMSLRLRQAGLFPELAEEDRLHEYRARQFATSIASVLAALSIGLLLQLRAPVVVLLGLLGVIVGVGRSRGRVDREIALRRDRMRIEIYTVNQLLAIRIRVGGGVIQAVQQFADRASGEVVAELREALALLRGGLSAAEAFGRIAQATPEPHAARTYALLAGAEERGVDLSEALLALSEDVREGRREAMKRQATKRRAAMLIPTIAVLAPVMLLFIAAPIPSIVFGGL